jgi:UDP-N-acetylmuramate dehydrogenase
LEKNFDLTEYNSYKIKSYCRKAYFPQSSLELQKVIKEIDDSPIVILGNGNNIILSKDFYEECFIIFNGNLNNISRNQDIINAEAGVTTKELSLFALYNRLAGFEIYYDIPSSVGGAIYMNAGASGEEITDNLDSVNYLDLNDLVVKTIAKKDICFSYRNSTFQQKADKIILSASFRLREGDSHTIQSKMLRIQEDRWRKQPRKYPNAGSVFKRPKGYYVGAMIEELGLKGFRIGGAQISKKHGGFIINTGNATGQDILDLIKLVKEKIKNRYGVVLEVEQQVI